MDAFTEAYLEAALWSSFDNFEEPLDKNYSINDIEESSRHSMEADCAAFQKENEGALQVFYQAGYLPERMEKAGHDFWLTRNGHGSGFWDETGVPKSVLEELTEASHDFGEQDLYEARGVVYVMGAEGPQEPHDPNKMHLTPSDETMLREMGIRAAQKSKLLKKADPGKKVAEKRPASSVLRGYAITGANPSRRGLQPWDWHALNIALQTMRMNPAMQGVMGQSEEDARKVIRQITGREYEQLPESMKRGRAPKSVPASLRPKKEKDMKTAMSRKDYILIADVLRKAAETSSGYRPAINYVASQFATALKQENPGFDANHFLSVVEGKKELTSRPPRGQEQPHGRGWAEPPMNVSGSKKPRLAGAKLAVDPAYLQTAKELIANDDPIIYDVAADMGQIVGNVKHMSWFIQAVAEWLEEDPTYAGEAQRGI